MPVNPLEPVNPVINSCGVVGTGAITCGTIDVEYPIPPSLIVTEVMTPLVILPVAVATCVLIPVVGTPTEIDVVVPTYPSPPSFTIIDCTVPPTEITADKLATLGVIDSSTTNTPMSFGLS